MNFGKEADDSLIEDLGWAYLNLRVEFPHLKEALPRLGLFAEHELADPQHFVGLGSLGVAGGAT